MKKSKLVWLLFFLFCYLVSSSAWAWDSAAHRIIAAIAYANLTPTAKEKVDQLTLLLDRKYPPQARFLYISTLPDKWRKKNPGSAAWHFYDTPWTNEAVPIKPPQVPNLLTALPEIISRLGTEKDQKQQAIDLAYLVHLAGDAHQPLHCINRFSKDLPHGDRGGNLFRLPMSGIKNLHNYWDKSAYLLAKNGQHYPLHNQQVMRLAKELEQQYPQRDRELQIKDDNVSHWVAECFAIASSVAYNTSPNTRPSMQYQALMVNVVSSQLALAGYRLAKVINNLFTETATVR